jgi:hypothetical protein
MRLGGWLDRKGQYQYLDEVAGTTTDSSLRTSIIFFHDSECSEPRDDVYALLGLTSDGGDDIEIDYANDPVGYYSASTLFSSRFISPTQISGVSPTLAPTPERPTPATLSKTTIGDVSVKRLYAFGTVPTYVMTILFAKKLQAKSSQQ